MDKVTITDIPLTIEALERKSKRDLAVMILWLVERLKCAESGPTPLAPDRAGSNDGDGEALPAARLNPGR